MVSFIIEDYIQMEFISECGFDFNGTVHDNWLHACDWKIMVRPHFTTSWRTYKHIFVVKYHANCLPDCLWVINWNVLMFFEYSWLVLTDGGLQMGPGQHKNSQGLSFFKLVLDAFICPENWGFLRGVSVNVKCAKATIMRWWHSYHGKKTNTKHTSETVTSSALFSC